MPVSEAAFESGAGGCLAVRWIPGAVPAARGAERIPSRTATPGRVARALVASASWACAAAVAQAQPLAPAALVGKVAPRVRVVQTSDTQSRRVAGGSAVVVAPGPVQLNGGTRLERVTGEVPSSTQPVAGEMDAAMPPGGRGLPGVAAGQTWQTDYRVGDPASGADFRWTASVSGPTEIAVPADRFVVFLIRYSRVVARAPGGRMPGGYRGPAEACVWHAPELGRVVRFEFEARPQFSAREQQAIELTRIARAP